MNPTDINMSPTYWMRAHANAATEALEQNGRGDEDWAIAHWQYAAQQFLTQREIESSYIHIH